ncbi:MAG: YihY/virulence factor BrkB family protein [Verrucomicrobiales bacterium]|nr:YihY/virulence factor BrkB family protein [Verrucomicrobiales bacterium]MCP5560522.1 YihY/virulence factor BrkB family protein [Verrucomicrobiaceae bacterium]
MHPPSSPNRSQRVFHAAAVSLWIQIRSWWVILKRTAEEWVEDNVLRLSAALAFYTMLSLSPLLMLVLMGCGWLFGADAVQGELDTQLRGVMGPQAAAAAQAMVSSAATSDSGLLAGITSLIAMLFGATGVFGEIKDALNTMWRVNPPVDHPALRTWVRTRLLSFGMVVVVMFLLVASLMISTTISFAATYFSEGYWIAPQFWGAATFAAGFAMEIVLFALLFVVLPDVRIPISDALWGATITALLFEIGKWGLAWYLGRESTASAYGAAGSLMLVMLWTYYTAVIVLTGAEFTQVRSKVRNSSFKSTTQ